ncbi:MAG: RNA polymerase sigma factor [Caldilinea sp. CFX5]|nr:RNA polymerase sigma factor [Caldilinea sp. CFX5]
MDYPLYVEAAPRGWLAGDAPSDAQPSPLYPQDPQTLIAWALGGDRSAFNQLIATLQGVAQQIAYRILRNEEAAADAVQDALLKTFHALATFRGGSFKSWFLRIVVNTCYDVVRKRAREVTTSLDALPVEPETGSQLVAPLEPPERYAERMELQRWLHRGLATLPADQRQVVILFDVEGYSYNEIVAMTGAPMGTVKSRLSRGRVRLRDYLVRHKVL